MPQSYYISADFQLFIVGVFFIAILKKFEGSKIMISLLIFIGFFIPLAITALTYYYLGWPWMYPPEPHRYLLMFDKIFQNIHISTFIGVDCYFTGVLAEMITSNKKVREVISKSIAFKILFYISIPLQILLIASGAFFMSELGKPSLTYAIYAAIVKKFWAVTVASLIIGCMQTSECEKC